MGIPKFFGRFLKNIDKSLFENKLVQKNLPKDVTCFCFDFNSFLHMIAQRFYHYDKGWRGKELEERTKELRKLINTELPDNVSLKELFEIYISQEKIDMLELEQSYFKDLVYNLEKIVKSVRPEYLVVSVDGLVPMGKIIQQRKRRYNKKKSAGDIFDSNCITPGTAFMERLDKYLTNYFKFSKICKNTIYSGYKVEGEGEHKIFSMYRNGKIPKTGNHIIYGQDADLIILSAVSDIENLYVMRNDFRGYEYVDIKQTRSWLSSKFGTDPVDFMCLTFLVGNDFLPKMPQMYDIKSSMYSLLHGYKQVGKKIVNNSQINFSVIREILEYIENIDLSNFDNDFKGTLLDQSINLDYIKPEPCFEFLKNNKDKDRMVIFEKMWNSKSILPRPDNNTFQNMLNFPFVKKDFYESELDMGESFINGVAWCFNYYTGRPIDKYFFYNYHYAPTLNTVIDYLSKMTSYPNIKSNSVKNGMLSIREQMLCVLPPVSFSLLPPEYLKYVENDMALLESQCPRYCEKVMDGIIKNEEHDAVLLVPFPDINFIFTVTGGAVEDKYIGTMMKFDNKTKGYGAIVKANTVYEQKKYIKKISFDDYPDYVKDVNEVEKNDIELDNIDFSYIIKQTKLSFDHFKDFKKK